MLGEIFCRAQVSPALALRIVGDDFALGRREHRLPRLAITFGDKFLGRAFRDDDEKPRLPIVPARTHRGRFDHLDDEPRLDRVGLKPPH